MSRLVADALQRKAAAPGHPPTDAADSPAAGTPIDEAAEYSEPRFDPLAGARRERPPHWRRAAFFCAYAGLLALIGWQGIVLLSPEPETESLAEAETAAERPQISLRADSGLTETWGLSSWPQEEFNLVLPARLPEPDPEAPSAQPAGDPVPEPSKGTGSASDSGPDIARVTQTVTDESSSAEAPLEDLPELAPPTADNAAVVAVQVLDAEPIEQVVEPTAGGSDSGTRFTASGQTSTASTGTVFSSTERQQALREARQRFDDGDRERALSSLRERLARDDHTDVRQQYARLLLRDGQAETARYAVRPGHNRQELELRAYADYQAGAYSDARRHYEELLRRADNPQQEWYLWLAICNDHLQNDGQAILYFETYLNRTQGQPESLVRYARERLQQLSG
ncbi:MAG: hypothetical protein LAT62_02605 [Natronospirillum sp.]|uniref:hypothetical protein n=1 Tax=Natronospirillum sp. TaxID=2812955 RepID=UPI0025D29724|nr:hypothetical protein [Natronospirillum sp.]MCH8550799.1 hypothetical protein [Natronospirillum sp.]